MADFEVHNPEIEKLLRDLGHMIGKGLPAGFGFTLMIFNLSRIGTQTGEEALFYISSAQRADMRMAMREFLRKV